MPDRFPYPSINTIDHNNQRWYCVSDTEIYPSITTVLGYTMPPDKAASLQAWRDRVGKEEAERISRAATDRGSAVHRLIELHLIEEGSRDFREELAKHPKSYVAMFNAMRIKLKRVSTVYGQEVALYNRTLGVAGRCDCVGEWEGVQSIIDFKTSNRVKTVHDIEDYWLQIAFYAAAHNEMFGTDIRQGVVLMGVEENPALVFKKDLVDPVYLELINRVNTFYQNEYAKIV